MHQSSCPGANHSHILGLHLLFVPSDLLFVMLKISGNALILGRSRSSKVIDFGTNRKCVCDFLLVCHSNLGPILHRFGDIAGFLCSCPPPIFHPNFGGVPVAPDRPCRVSPSRSLKLFGREIIFEVCQPICHHGT